MLSGLRNPSGVSFSPQGLLTVCDSGHGKVIVVEKGKPRDQITGFATEFWKVDKESGAKRFQLGPLTALWKDSVLVVTDGGVGDGAETLAFFEHPGDAATGRRSPPVKSLEDDPSKPGEGNLTGGSIDPNTGEIFLCGHGDDSKTWILRYDWRAGALEKWASSDDNGITVNSPMQTLVESPDHLLVLYSGAGGKEDGLVVRWDRKTRKPLKSWTLPGLVDPMGMARKRGQDQLYLVDNNWALTEVKSGKLARVSLGDEEAAKVEILPLDLRGPVSCAFGPDGRLYVAQLGVAIDAENGEVLAISGL
ncbi:MAG: hypothetical protein H6807_01070 [Planctomycetes bacterium]|nr:hypothetical protein [Planctomycetota bacterium]